MRNEIIHHTQDVSERRNAMGENIKEKKDQSDNGANAESKPTKKSFKKEAWIFYVVMLTVPVLHWLLMWLFVNIQTIMLAFKNPVTGAWDFKINYQWLWQFQLNISKTATSYNGSLLEAFKNTMLFFAISVFITLPLSVVIAYFIYKKICGYKVFRLAFYLPAVIPAIVMTTVYKQVTQHGGIIDRVFHNVPLGGLLETPSTALKAVIVFVLLCSFTTNVLLFSGGMARIPMEVIEAAKLDGCGTFQEIVVLIVPLIWPTVTTQIILAFTNMFNGGGPVMMLTSGQNGTMTIAYWLFYCIAGTGRTAITEGGGVGVYHVSAVGLLLTAIAVPIVLLVRKIFNSVEAVEY